MMKKLMKMGLVTLCAVVLATGCTAKQEVEETETNKNAELETPVAEETYKLVSHKL